MRSGFRATTMVLLAAFGLGACASDEGGMRAESYQTPPYALPVTALWQDGALRVVLQRDPANERDQIFVSDHSRNVLRVSTDDGQEPIAQAVPITSDHVRDLNATGSCRVAIDGGFGGRWAALRAVVAMAHRATNRAATTSDRSASFELPHRPHTRSASEAARFAREAELRAFRLKMAGLRR